MKLILDYEISHTIHESANSQIYRAVHRETGQNVVLKQLKGQFPPPQQVAGFKREYEIVNSFHAPGIIQVYSLKNFDFKEAILSIRNIAEKMDIAL